MQTLESGPAKLLDYLQLMRVDRPIGCFLLLWPTLWALWFAGKGNPDPTIVVIFLLGTYVMRAAGCIINDIADRNVDPHVHRTRNRPLARGVIRVAHAAMLFILLLGIAFLLVLQLNFETIRVAFIAATVAVVYPYLKRFTHLPQLVLGIAFSMGIPLAYTALTGHIPDIAWMLFTANFLWIVAYDTQYAMADRRDDLLIGVKSTAILFGRFDKLIVGVLHLATLVLLAVFGLMNTMSWHYYLGLLMASGFAVYQQYLCKDNLPERCFRAFQNNNWFGAMVFTGIVLSFMQSKH
ncbi:MAG: 4-hydroxybenzoate octaprenyltransferase [Gammaproteobacteria bacterium]|nr:4-hydroxybenzoate octaprenyltransferase [Gammaproteobacteria bacterium]